MKQNQLFPTLFISHGSPMNALLNNQYTNNWEKLGQFLPTPKAIVCISAHWEANGVYVTAMKNPKTIHDFGGFSKQLSQFQYPCPGCPQLAQQIAQHLKQFNVKLDKGQWGLDHGSWVVISKMYPKANIPVVELSLNTNFTPLQHYKLAQKLSWLRNKQVLIIGSGTIIHSFDQSNSNYPNSGLPWAIQMRNKSNEMIKKRQHDKLINYEQQGQEFIIGINSAQHYLPLLYPLALQQPNEETTIFNDGFSNGSFSLTSVLIADKNNPIHNIFS